MTTFECNPNNDECNYDGNDNDNDDDDDDEINTHGDQFW